MDRQQQRVQIYTVEGARWTALVVLKTRSMRGQASRSIIPSIDEDNYNLYRFPMTRGALQ